MGGTGKFYVCHHGKPAKTCVANSITSPETCYGAVVADPQCGHIFHFHSKTGGFECVCIIKGQESTVIYHPGGSADWNVYLRSTLKLIKNIPLSFFVVRRQAQRKQPH